MLNSQAWAELGGSPVVHRVVRVVQLARLVVDALLQLQVHLKAPDPHPARQVLPLCQQRELAAVNLRSEHQPRVRDVGQVEIVGLGRHLAVVVLAEPLLLAAALEARHQHRHPRDLAHVQVGKAKGLGSDGVLLAQRILGLMELQRIIRAERDIQPLLEDWRTQRNVSAHAAKQRVSRKPQSIL